MTKGSKHAWKDAWILMRIPFSIFLMPVFWLSLAVIPSGAWLWVDALMVFIVLHLFLYPASNGYNSMVDKDEGPIGGVKQPPQVNIQLRFLVVVFDIISLLFAFVHGLYFGFSVAVYWLVSRAYSSPQIRLKKHPILSWITVAFFQGGWTVLMVWAGLQGNWSMAEEPHHWLWVLTATLFLAGSYPLTQIYQHQEDISRGDVTISVLLGVKGTFLLAASGLSLGTASLVCGLVATGQTDAILVLGATSLPVFYYFSVWGKRCFADADYADYEHTMRFNQISSICLSLGFVLVLLLKNWGISLALHP